MCPTQAMASLMMRLVIPPAFMNSPASMKKGTASSGKLLAPSHMFCTTICGSVMPRCTIRASAQPSRANEMGVPMATKKSSVAT